MKKVLSPLLAAVGLVVVAQAQAQVQFAKPEDAYKYRAAVMTLQVAHMGRINGQLRSDKPSLQVVAENTAVLDTLNKLFFTAFPDGSDMVANTRAKPEIWKQSAKFKEYADKLNAEVSRLNAAAKANDLAATRTAFAATGQACKACHDDFRKD
jgi:cytochrome c556